MPTTPVQERLELRLDLDHAPKWLGRVLTAIQALKDLPENWDSYGAVPVDVQSISVAVDCLRQIADTGISEPAVLATPSGHVNLTWDWSSDKKSCEIEFLATGQLHYAYLDLEDSSRNEEGVVSQFGRVVHLIQQA